VPKMILRDDDLNGGCSAEDVMPFFDAAKLFDEVVLSFVPFPVGNSQVGLPATTDTEKDSSLLNNTSLVNKVKELIALGNISIAMHGVNHAGYGEFSVPIPSEDILQAKNYLEEIFGTRVDTFTPPNNILSRENYYRIHSAGFRRIISAFSNWPHERPITTSYFLHFFRSSLLALTGRKRQRILGGIYHKGMVECPSFIAYRNTDLESLPEDIIRSYGSGCGDVIIATHYWELWKTDPDRLIRVVSQIGKQCRSFQ